MESHQHHETKSIGWLERPVWKSFPGFTREILIIAIILILAFASRFAILGYRVMAHDEVNHVVPAYSLYKGNGYLHDPLTHGPFQFHLLALSYFLLGDSDFSARVPAALFSIAAIFAVLFPMKRYLGKAGALAGGFLFVISPLTLFYGRYTRNEAFIELFAVLTLYGILRYFEKRDNFSLYLLAAVSALQFATKETAFIYTAQLLLFCGFIFLRDLWQLEWKDRVERIRAALIALCALLLLTAGFLLYQFGEFSTGSRLFPLATFSVSAGAIVLIYWFVYMIRRFRFQTFRRLASFNLIIFIWALILPQLAAIPVKLLGWNPLDYSQTGMVRTGSILAGFLILSFLIGIWWNRNVFLKAATTFYLIFITFFTTFFSNGHGFFTGIIGSLGYWLSQHEVQRGGQPLYYYGTILLPIYEFAAIIGLILGLYYALRHRLFWNFPGERISDSISVNHYEDSEPLTEESDGCTVFDDEALIYDNLDSYEFIDRYTPEPGNLEYETHVERSGYFVIREKKQQKVPAFLLFIFWVISALIAYSVAGEKMPWLGVHIAIPIALGAGWGLGILMERSPWDKILSAQGWIGLGCLIIGSYALGSSLAGVMGINPPFQGKELHQLRATNQFVFAAICLLLALIVIIRVWRGWRLREILSVVTLYAMVILCLLQARTAYQSSFIHYDYANEYLVYAHAAPGPKIVLNQIEEIAARTGTGKSIKVAYDNDARYPYWWYFRDYSARLDFDEKPTRTLRDYDVIIANTSKDDQLQPIVQRGYTRYETMRLWWPNQDYFNLTPARIWNALSNPAMRAAIFDIWLNRDFTKYAQTTGKASLTPETWDPAGKMAVYIRKDIISKMWQLGDASLTAVTDDKNDVYFEDEKFVELNPVFSLGSAGSGEGQFNAPRGVAIAQNGDIFVLDSDNNRVQRFSPDGQFITSWARTGARRFESTMGYRA